MARGTWFSPKSLTNLSPECKVQNLGPDDSQLATAAHFNLTFRVAGTYVVCYKKLGDQYTQVGTSTISVSAVAPTVFSHDADLVTGNGTHAEYITLAGGAGLNLGPGQDSMKGLWTCEPVLPHQSAMSGHEFLD